MNLKKLTNISVMTALAVVFMIFLKFPIPFLPPFLIYEPGDIPILIISFLYGPIPALISTFISSVLMELTTGLGGPWGILMHFIATGTFVTTAGLIYQKMHSRKGAIIGLISGTIAMTVIMIPANLIVTPIYLGASREQVIKLLVPGIIPFNLIKAALNSIFTVIVYKYLANFLRSKGLIKANNLAK
ncbi:MAG: ECF transporter S component [bacterium]